MSYQDLHVAHGEQTVRFVDAGGQSLNRQFPEISFDRNDTLGLAADEAAELVALDVTRHVVYVDDNDFSTQGNVRFHADIGINFADAGWTRDNDLVTDNIGTSGELSGRTRLEEDSRLLYTSEVAYQNAVNTAGEGAPINYDPVSGGMKHFRAMFGEGPVVDETDALQVGAAMNATNMGGAANVVGILNWTLYADVFEVERSRIRRAQQ